MVYILFAIAQIRTRDPDYESRYQKIDAIDRSAILTKIVNLFKIKYYSKAKIVMVTFFLHLWVLYLDLPKAEFVVLFVHSTTLREGVIIDHDIIVIMPLGRFY